MDRMRTWEVPRVVKPVVEVETRTKAAALIIRVRVHKHLLPTITFKKDASSISCVMKGLGSGWERAASQPTSSVSLNLAAKYRHNYVDTALKHTNTPTRAQTSKQKHPYAPAPTPADSWPGHAPWIKSPRGATDTRTRRRSPCACRPRRRARVRSPSMSLPTSDCCSHTCMGDI